MNTNPDSPTRSTDNAHTGQTSGDNNPFYSPVHLPACPYDRRKALADGLQREVPSEYLRFLHREWDMLLPSRVYLTRKVIEHCQITDIKICHDRKGRLWEILNVLEVAVGNSLKNLTSFQVRLEHKTDAPLITLHAGWSTADIDDPAPAVTVMLSDEIHPE